TASCLIDTITRMIIQLSRGTMVIDTDENNGSGFIAENSGRPLIRSHQLLTFKNYNVSDQTFRGDIKISFNIEYIFKCSHAEGLILFHQNLVMK
ncbi:hypothetical protein L9F63_023295, partial [Diploptera punctata]